MMLITEMNIPDYSIPKIISDYRKLVKLSEAIPEGDPFRSLLNFMEDIIPAFKNTLVDGEIIDEYYRLRELAMSNADDACVIPGCWGKHRFKRMDIMLNLSIRGR